jgi:hypothetical protein
MELLITKTSGGYYVYCETATCSKCFKLHNMAAMKESEHNALLINQWQAGPYIFYHFLLHFLVFIFHF